MTGLALSVFIYLAVFGTSALVVQYGYRRQNYWIQLLGLLPPILLAGLRYNVGLDYLTYLNAYADIINPLDVNRYSATPGLEYTFYLITYIANILFASPIAVFFVYSVITLVAYYKALVLLKPKYIAPGLFLYYSIFYLNSFNIMRQGAAISIGSLALVYYVKGDKLKAVIYILIASLFHISALLLLAYILVGYLLERFFIQKKNISSFVAIFSTTLATTTIVAFAGILIEPLGKLTYIATGQIGEYGSTISLGVVYKYLLSLLCLLLVVYVWKKFNSSEKKLALLVSLGTIVYSLGLVHNESARLGIYLIALIPVLFAVASDKLSLWKDSHRILFQSAPVVLGIMYIIAVHWASGNGVQYNYQSVIDSQEYEHKLKELGL